MVGAMKHQDESGCNPLEPDDIGSPEDVGNRIRELRRKRGWTLRQLAERLSTAGYAVDHTGVLRMEGPPSKGRRQRIDIEALAALCRVFDIPAEELLRSRQARLDAAEQRWVETYDSAFSDLMTAILRVADVNRAFNWAAVHNEAAGSTDIAEQERSATALIRHRIAQYYKAHPWMKEVVPGFQQALDGLVEQAEKLGRLAFIGQLSQTTDKFERDALKVIVSVDGLDEVTDTEELAAWAAKVPWGDRINLALERKDD